MQGRVIIFLYNFICKESYDKCMFAMTTSVCSILKYHIIIHFDARSDPKVSVVNML